MDELRSSPGEGPANRAPSVEFTHTPQIPELLTALNISIFVTTYQAQRLLTFSVNEHRRLSMLMRIFERPTGLYVDRQRMALVARNQTWLFESTPDVWDASGNRLPNDLCYVPRQSYVTGDIAGHQIDRVGDEYIMVNTRFSCLSRLSPHFSFEPVWRPRFISRLAAEDRCHLNGMYSENGRVRFVSALGETDTALGWQPGKKTGGVLIDVDSNEVIARGMAMPHSPRVHANKLWILESGMGELQIVDPNTGVRETVIRLPGFLRGLAFYDRFAFVGLCKIREGDMFRGLRISELYPRLLCAVCIVDIVTGREVGIIEFTKGIEELFDISVLAGVRRPEIVGFEEDTVNGLFILPPGV